MFETKQGDPQSSLLFNAVLQMALKGDLPRRQRTKGMGICFGDCELGCLTNLRYADDVLLFATTKEQLQNMMCEFKHSTQKVGLNIHPGKPKILSNQSSSRRKEMVIDNIKVEILTKEESTKYLEQMVTFQQQEAGCLGNVLHIQARVDLKILPSSAPVAYPTW